MRVVTSRLGARSRAGPVRRSPRYLQLADVRRVCLAGASRSSLPSSTSSATAVPVIALVVEKMAKTASVVMGRTAGDAPPGSTLVDIPFPVGHHATTPGTAGPVTAPFRMASAATLNCARHVFLGFVVLMLDTGPLSHAIGAAAAAGVTAWRSPGSRLAATSAHLCGTFRRRRCRRAHGAACPRRSSPGTRSRLGNQRRVAVSSWCSTQRVLELLRGFDDGFVVRRAYKAMLSLIHSTCCCRQVVMLQSAAEGASGAPS